MIGFNNIEQAFKKFKHNQPFDHCVADNFFYLKIAKALESDFPSYEDKAWFDYNNPLEQKKSLNPSKRTLTSEQSMHPKTRKRMIRKYSKQFIWTRQSTLCESV